MPTPSDRRSRKRLATRRAISAVADRLFRERGFDHVTVDEIADAADVGRMTVFNHFARKEDMFFDRDDEVREVLREALRQRDPRVTPIEKLRLLAHRLVSERAPYLDFSTASQSFIETVEHSETLIARARAIRDELAQVVTEALSASVGRDPADSGAHLAAGLLLATWTVAFLQAHQIFRQTQDTGKARATFLAIVDKGTTGLKAAMAATPYASCSTSARHEMSPSGGPKDDLPPVAGATRKGGKKRSSPKKRSLHQQAPHG